MRSIEMSTERAFYVNTKCLLSGGLEFGHCVSCSHFCAFSLQVVTFLSTSLFITVPVCLELFVVVVFMFFFFHVALIITDYFVTIKRYLCFSVPPAVRPSLIKRWTRAV